MAIDTTPPLGCNKLADALSAADIDAKVTQSLTGEAFIKVPYADIDRLLVTLRAGVKVKA